MPWEPKMDAPFPLGNRREKAYICETRETLNQIINIQ